MELLIDGVRYKLWTPKEEAALEDMVKEHTKDIFGEDSIYFDIKQKIKSKAGVASIPDGYAITFEDRPKWYIAEVELASHGVYEHIMPQMGKFIRGIRNPLSQKEIVDALFEEISKDEALKERIQSKIGSTEIFKFLSDLLSQPPKLAILIDQDTEELREAAEGLKLETEVVEFRTFVREDTGISKHAHLFEPLWPPTTPRVEFLEELRKRFAEKKPEVRLRRLRAVSHYYSIPIAHEGIHLEWLFWGDEGLGVELHMERVSREENYRLLEKIRANSAELEKNIGERLVFGFPWHRKWARVYTLKEPIELAEGLKQWAVDTMVRFYEAFKPLLDEIDTKS